MGVLLTLLGYFNGVLFQSFIQSLGMPLYVQNSAASVGTQAKPWKCITSTLIHLHWLLGKQSIIYNNIILLTPKSLTRGAAFYLSNLLPSDTPSHSPRSLRPGSDHWWNVGDLAHS
ncbi:unnamed protein product [Lota lota]